VNRIYVCCGDLIGVAKAERVQVRPDQSIIATVQDHIASIATIIATHSPDRPGIHRRNPKQGFGLGDVSVGLAQPSQTGVAALEDGRKSAIAASCRPHVNSVRRTNALHLQMTRAQPSASWPDRSPLSIHAMRAWIGKRCRAVSPPLAHLSVGLVPGQERRPVRQAGAAAKQIESDLFDLDLDLNWIGERVVDG